MKSKYATRRVKPRKKFTLKSVNIAIDDLVANRQNIVEELIHYHNKKQEDLTELEKFIIFSDHTIDNIDDLRERNYEYLSHIEWKIGELLKIKEGLIDES